MFKRWSDARESLKFVSCKSEIIDEQFNYTVTLKNISAVKCFIIKGLFGPSEVRLIIKEDRIVDIDSLKKKYGVRQERLFGHISSKTIEPYEEATYTTVVPGLTDYKIYAKLTCNGFNLKYRSTHKGRLLFWMRHQAFKEGRCFSVSPGKNKLTIAVEFKGLKFKNEKNQIHFQPAKRSFTKWTLDSQYKHQRTS